MSRRAWLVAFGAAVAVQCVVLYAPRAPGTPGGFPWDKVVHVAVFALVAAIGMRAGIAIRWLSLGLIAQAVASEVVQGLLLPNRSGDAGDLAADLFGIAGGLVLGTWWSRRRGAAIRENL